MPKATDALKILDRLSGDDAELRELIEQATVNAQVARLIHEARTKAGLTQRQLAALAGAKQHLRIKAFHGTSENAVKTQIWVAVSV